MQYPINQYGIECLQQVRKDINDNRERISDAVKSLLRTVDNYETELGEYYNRIREMLERVQEIQGQGDEAIDNLTEVIIPRQIRKIEELISLFGA